MAPYGVKQILNREGWLYLELRCAEKGTLAVFLGVKDRLGCGTARDQRHADTRQPNGMSHRTVHASRCISLSYHSVER